MAAHAAFRAPAKGNRNKNIIATKLERWANDERGELWNEVPERRRESGGTYTARGRGASRDHLFLNQNDPQIYISNSFNKRLYVSDQQLNTHGQHEITVAFQCEGKTIAKVVTIWIEKTRETHI